MGGAVEALALEEVIQPAEVKQNHGGRLRLHPSRLPATSASCTRSETINSYPISIQSSDYK